MEAEFIQMINNNRALIFKVCNLYCRDPESRKDLFQEIVLQLWKSFPGFRKESTSSTWIYKVAINTAISNLRRESRKPVKQSLQQPDFEIPDLKSNSQDDEQWEMLKLAIEKLTEIEKAILLLYLDEKSYDEMSEIMGISGSNVGARLNRIKTKLIKLVKNELI